MEKTNDRVYFLDWLRVGALGLLILYHCDLPYVVRDWVARSAHEVDGHSWIGALISDWQMALLFLVAGAAMRFSTGRDGALRAMADRMRRLSPAIALGLLALAPIQAACARAAGLDISGLAEGHRLFQHVWFLPFLLTYATLAACIAWAAPSVSDRIGALFERATRGVGALAAPMLFLVAGAVVSAQIPRTYAIWNDIGGHLKYAGLFAIGFYAGASLWARFEAHRREALVVFAVAMLARLAIDGAAHQTAEFAVAAVCGAMTIVALCGYGRRLVNRNSPLLRALNRAVMPIYLLHQPVLAIAMLGLAPLALGEPMERVALIALTALGSWSVYRALDASSLRLLLGLSAPPRPSEGRGLPAYAGLRAAGD